MSIRKEFLYPADLVAKCKEGWERFHRRLTRPVVRSEGDHTEGPERVDPPFPSDEHLLELIETVYHLSFLAEEGRRIAIRVIYLPPHTFEHRNGLNLHGEPARLLRPAKLSVGELLKLAPAVQATESAILVCSPEGEISDRLAIWGILNLGTEWWNLVTGADSAALCPPDCLTISSFAPGALTVSVLGAALVRLRNGRLIGTPLPELDEGPIGDFLRSAAQKLYEETTAVLGIARYSSEPDSDHYPINLYFRTLSRLLHLIREQRHGGALLVLPDELHPEDGRLADRLAIKYRIEIPEVWKTLIREAEGNHHYYRLLFPEKLQFLTHSKTATASDLKELIKWERNLERSRERISEFCSFVASLSAVDGAVVITKTFKVLGFGAEIIAASPSLKFVKEAADSTVTKSNLVPVERYGTRHRSAMRMCSSFEDCIALVVSQDGPVKAIKRVGADVVMWNDVTLGRMAI